MLVIPAIDILQGRAVRLYQGDYTQVTDYGDPIEVARRFADEGAEWLHLVDLDGAKLGAPENVSVIGTICNETELKVEVGGGVRTLSCAKMLIELGAKRVIVGTRLVQDESAASVMFSTLGARAVAGIDTRDGRVSTHGWVADSQRDGIEFAQHMQDLGCQRVIFTDVSTDGTLQGPNVEATRKMVEQLNIPVIASGGVSSLEDLDRLAESGVEGAIVGKALYEGRFTVSEALSAISR